MTMIFFNERRHMPGLHDLLVIVPVSADAKDDLIMRMAEPHRHYHGQNHLDTLWKRHRWLSAEAGFDAQLDQLVGCAIAYHDAVFEIGAKDNEARSADLWMKVSAASSSLSPEAREWVAETILATADHAGARLDLDDAAQRARQWVLDLDLSTLGESADVFDVNVELLRAETPWLDDGEWNLSLTRALREFASRHHLYRCSTFVERFTAPAHRNFERHLSRLQAERSCGASSSNFQCRAAG